MRTRRILVVLALVFATGLLATPNAHAGNWAETVLDPPPATIESSVTYTFGFWVLQHGSYPFKGNLGTVELIATDEEGNVVGFPVTELGTPAHYSAEVVFPYDGVWQISADHDALMPDENVARVVVPGAVELSPSDVAQRAPYEWGAIRPSFPPTADGAQVAAPENFPANDPQLPVKERDVEEAASEATDEPGTDLPIGLVIAAGLATVGLAAWLARRYARSNRAV